MNTYKLVLKNWHNDVVSRYFKGGKKKTSTCPLLDKLLMALFITSKAHLTFYNFIKPRICNP